MCDKEFFNPFTGDGSRRSDLLRAMRGRLWRVKTDTGAEKLVSIGVRTLKNGDSWPSRHRDFVGS